MSKLGFNPLSLNRGPSLAIGDARSAAQEPAERAAGDFRLIAIYLLDASPPAELVNRYVVAHQSLGAILSLRSGTLFADILRHCPIWMLRRACLPPVRWCARRSSWPQRSWRPHLCRRISSSKKSGGQLEC
jgi:hypothetical protein